MIPVVMHASTEPTPDTASLASIARRWFLPTAPGVIARRHLLWMFVFLVIGVLVSLIMRLELMSPSATLVTHYTYQRLFSLHGMLMVYFVLLPSFPGVLGHTLLPPPVGVSPTAFPRLANAAWHLLALGGLVVIGSFLTGGVGAGWAFDHEFGGTFQTGRALPTVAGLALGTVGLLLLAVNTVITIWRLETRRTLHLWHEAPLALTLLLAGLLALPAYGLLLGCLAMMAATLLWEWPLFQPAFGGDPQLFLGLFRMFSVPMVFIVALPCLGLITEVIRRHARRPVSGRLFPGALLLLALSGLFAWLPLAEPAAWLPSSSLLAGIAGILTVAALFAILGHWLHLLRGGITTFSTALVYALGGVLALATAAAGSLLILQPATFDILRRTTFVTGAGHLLATAALGMAFLAGLHEARRSLSGHVAGATVGLGAAMVIVISTPLAFGPTLLLGLRGLLARQQTYLPEFQTLQVLATAGTTLLLGGLLAAILALLRPTSDPLGATSIH